MVQLHFPVRPVLSFLGLSDRWSISTSMISCMIAVPYVEIESIVIFPSGVFFCFLSV